MNDPLNLVSSDGRVVRRGGFACIFCTDLGSYRLAGRGRTNPEVTGDLLLGFRVVLAPN